MPERKAKRQSAAKIVEEAAASAPGLPRGHEVELALKAACLAEATPREELVRRITVEWLRAKGYLR